MRARTGQTTRGFARAAGFDWQRWARQGEARTAGKETRGANRREWARKAGFIEGEASRVSARRGMGGQALFRAWTGRARIGEAMLGRL